ncbi:MAG: efflux RND transporter periplasmic adaptor subunit [Rhodoferax sp.]|nr:efflux RND transporter periplasmic adaptor subunit [Rhodoferax sp.]MBP9927817.1 efflux RND transporter periplasmic adaptor subunit [Rhodoferax sp.]HQZ04617.1 efflux RND transporter periplasmic adaptor subunit [Burkholderiaceae bacterium]
MQRKTLLFGGIAVAALAALLVWAFAPRPIDVEVATASVGRFETTIDEDARTRLSDRFVVSAPLAGNMQRMTLREGDTVSAGDTLVSLTPVLSPMLDERTIREQNARIGAAEATVLQASSHIGAAMVALEQARMTQRRTEQLAQQGFVSPNKIDSDRLATRTAQSDLTAATEGERIARYNLTQARAALAAVRGSTGSSVFTVRAPVGGQVLKLHQTSEGVVALGTPLIEIGDTTHMEVVAELLSTDALLARPGSAVRIERWGGPHVLQGRVRLVEPAAFTKVSALGVEEQRVNVLVDITSAHDQWKALGDGYRVGVRIVTLSEDSVLRVPGSAVFPLPASAGSDNSGFAVFVLEAGNARLRHVSIGGRNSSEAWIRQGLNAGDKVIVYPPSNVVDGSRVQPRKV